MGTSHLQPSYYPKGLNTLDSKRDLTMHHNGNQKKTLSG